MDLIQRAGNYPLPPGASSIMGVEFSGEVAELGPDVSNYKVGDAVIGLVAGVSRRCWQIHDHPQDSITEPSRVLMQSMSQSTRNS